MVNTRQAAQLTREELYERIWTTPMRHLAKEFGISDVGLAKICGRYQIPRPGVGHWARKAHGKRVRRTPLPPGKNLPRLPIVIRPGLQEGDEGVPTEMQESIAGAGRSRAVGFPDHLESPHPLVSRTMKSLRSARPDEQGLVRPRAKRCLDVAVSPESIDRASLILHVLLTELKRLDFSVSVDGEETAMSVHGEPIAFGLVEDARREEREPTRKEQREREQSPWLSRHPLWAYEPTGRLALEIRSATRLHGRKRWGDGKRQRVETLLPRFIAGAIRIAATIQERRAEEEERRRKQEAWERERHAKLQEIHAEEEKLKALERDSARWNEAARLRAYISAIEHMVSQEAVACVHGEEPAAFLAWARGQADRIDPLVASPRSILDERNRWS